MIIWGNGIIKQFPKLKHEVISQLFLNRHVYFKGCFYMSITEISPNNSNPTFFKLIPTIVVLSLVCVIIPFVLFYISFLITGFLVSLLQYIVLSEDILSFLKIFSPIIKVALAHPAASNGVCSRHRSKLRKRKQ